MLTKYPTNFLLGIHLRSSIRGWKSQKEGTSSEKNKSFYPNDIYDIKKENLVRASCLTWRVLETTEYSLSSFLIKFKASFAMIFVLS